MVSSDQPMATQSPPTSIDGVSENLLSFVSELDEKASLHIQVAVLEFDRLELEHKHLIYAIEADRIRDNFENLIVFAAEALEKSATDNDVANQTIASLETQLVESQEGMISVDFVASVIEAKNDKIAELETEVDERDVALEYIATECEHSKIDSRSMIEASHDRVAELETEVDNAKRVAQVARQNALVNEFRIEKLEDCCKGYRAKLNSAADTANAERESKEETLRELVKARQMLAESQKAVEQLVGGNRQLKETVETTEKAASESNARLAAAEENIEESMLLLELEKETEVSEARQMLAEPQKAGERIFVENCQLIKTVETMEKAASKSDDCVFKVLQEDNRPPVKNCKLKNMVGTTGKAAAKLDESNQAALKMPKTGTKKPLRGERNRKVEGRRNNRCPFGEITNSTSQTRTRWT